MTLQVRASSRTTHRTFQCSIPEPIRSWRKYPKHQSIAVEPAVEPLQVHHATDTEHHDQYQTRTARACVLPVPHAGGQNADKASEAVRPIPRQGHSIVHASDACGNRQRPTGRALPQAERRATPQEMGKAQTWRRLLPRCGNAGHVLPNACHRRAVAACKIDCARW